MKVLILFAGLCVSSVSSFAMTAQERLKDATEVFNDIMATPDKSIPQDLLGKAECVVIVPGMKKGAFIVGAEYGKGFATCRRGSGWGAPAAMKVEGGSVGFQIGAQGTDVVMLVMNKHGMDQLMKSKFTLGGDASIAAGPVGRHATAQTDATLGAEIYSWSRAKGLFAGVSLKGATLRAEESENADLYGKKMTTREVLTSNLPVPPAAVPLTSALTRYSSQAGANADRQTR